MRLLLVVVVVLLLLLVVVGLLMVMVRGWLLVHVLLRCVLAMVVVVVLLLVLVVTLVPGGVVTDIVKPLTVVSLIVRKDRKGWSARPPMVGLAVRSGGSDHFLASVIESTKASLLRRRRRKPTDITIRGSRTRRRLGCVTVVIIASFVVTTSTGFFVRTSFFVTQKGSNVAIIARPTARTKKVVTSTATPWLVSVIHLHIDMVRRVTRVERYVRVS